MANFNKILLKMSLKKLNNFQINFTIFSRLIENNIAQTSLKNLCIVIFKKEKKSKNKIIFYIN